MAEGTLNGPRYNPDMLIASCSTDVAIVEQGGVRTKEGGEICDPAVDARAKELANNPQELVAAIQRLVGTTSATEVEPNA